MISQDTITTPDSVLAHLTVTTTGYEFQSKYDNHSQSDNYQNKKYQCINRH